MALKRPKQKGGAKKKKAQSVATASKSPVPAPEKDHAGSGDEKDPDEYYSDEVSPFLAIR